MFGFFSKISATENGSAYNYEFVGLDGNSIKLSDYIINSGIGKNHTITKIKEILKKHA